MMTQAQLAYLMRLLASQQAPAAPASQSTASATQADVQSPGFDPNFNPSIEPPPLPGVNEPLNQPHQGIDVPPGVLEQNFPPGEAMIPAGGNQYYPADQPPDFSNIAPPVDPNAYADIPNYTGIPGTPTVPLIGDPGTTGSGYVYNDPYGTGDPGNVSIPFQDTTAPPDVASASGVEPDVLPAAPMTDPSIIDPSDPNNNLTRGGVDMPLYPTQQDVFPGVPGGPGQFFKDAFGNITDAAGNIIQAAGNFFANAGYQPPPGTTLPAGGPLAEGVLSSLPGESLPQGLFSGLGSPLSPPGGVSAGNLGGDAVVNTDIFANPTAWNDLRRWMSGQYSDPGILGMVAAQAPNPFSSGPLSGRGLSPQQMVSNQQYWGNVFRDRGYILPPAPAGPPERTGGGRQTLTRGTPPHATV